MIGADLKTVEEMENKEASKYFVFKEKSPVNFQSRVLKFKRRKISTNVMDIPRRIHKVHKDYGMGTRY